MSKPTSSRCLAATASLAIMVAACTNSAATPMDTARPSSSPSSSASLSGSPTAAPTRAVPTPAGTLPVLPAVPSGKWTGLEWFALPEGVVPGNSAPYGYSQFPNLFGWSRGYVDFIWDGRNSVVPWASADGLHWQPGPDLPPGDLPFTLPVLDPEEPQGCDFRVDSFVEAPAGLLVSARIVCEGFDEDQTVGRTLYSATWVSGDGLTWAAAVNLPAGELSAGGAGYIATDGQELWTSTDGSNWQPGALPSPALPEAIRWGHPIAFAGGFLLAPATRHTQFDHHANFPDGTTTSVFWSADGRTWSRQNPPGARSGLAEVWLDRINDNLLLLRQGTIDKASGDYSLTAWTSVDGRTWKTMATWKGISPTNSGTVEQGVLAPNGQVVTWGGHAMASHFDQGPTTVFGLDPAAARAYALKESGGDFPSWAGPGHTLALGPSGLLATDGVDGFWIGVPSVG